MSNTPSIIVRPTGKALGADIEGVDLSKPIKAETFQQIQKAWNDHLVLRFRGQKLSDADLIAFSRHFGTLDLAPITTSGEREIPEYPEINVISNVKVNGKAIGSLGSYESVWHTDMSYNPDPPKMSCLYSLEVPTEGGDTGFVNMYEAYEALPADLKEIADNYECKHDASRNSAGELRKGFSDSDDPREVPGALHPLAPAHPETGRRVIYLGRRRNAYIPGLPLEESEEILDRIWKHASQDKFRWDQVWKKGDLIFWDNRCTMHRRDAFDETARRLMHRTQIQGAAMHR
ncbi:TauD/TfdA dioxygenase family protein [Sneathiella sp.]|uniref:TauD/TfdA dioxygenase family protein n=1 Tax=Sneathiella sp. TaxID=1964365 RepID=UPI0035674EC3